MRQPRDSSTDPEDDGCRDAKRAEMNLRAGADARSISAQPAGASALRLLEKRTSKDGGI